jgi:transposase
MEAYSMDLRQRVIDAIDAHEETQEEIAHRFQVSDRWIRKLCRQRALTGSLAPKPPAGGRTATVAGETQEKLRRQVQEQPDASLEELRQACGIVGSLMCVWRALKRLGLPRKKSRCGPRNSKTPPSRPSAMPGRSGRPISTRAG